MASTRWRGTTYGQPAPAAPAAPAPTIGQANHSGAGAGTPTTTGKSFEEAMAEANSRGPGWGVAADPDNGGYMAVVVDQNVAREATLPNPGPAPTLPGDPMANRAPQTGLSPVQAISQYGANVGAFEGAVRSGMFGGGQQVRGPVQTAPGRFDFGGITAGGGNMPATEQAPAEVDRARIDALLGNVSKATSGLMGLGQRDLEFSAAQAQLRQGLEQGQRQALSLARSGNRRDRAGNEARAIQAGTELAAQTGQAAAGLRATEEAAQQQIRLDAYKAAGDLGLNAGALDLNVQQLDMNAATNFLNQLFNRENLQLQIDQQEAERVTNFVRDMALIEKDYYSLSMQERDAVRQDLTRRYGINKQTALALEQLERSDDINWGQLAISGLSGLITGSAQVGAAMATKSTGAG